MMRHPVHPAPYNAPRRRTCGVFAAWALVLSCSGLAAMAADTADPPLMEIPPAAAAPVNSNQSESTTPAAASTSAAAPAAPKTFTTPATGPQSIPAPPPMPPSQGAPADARPPAAPPETAATPAAPPAATEPPPAPELALPQPPMPVQVTEPPTSAPAPASPPSPVNFSKPAGEGKAYTSLMFSQDDIQKLRKVIDIYEANRRAEGDKGPQLTKNDDDFLNKLGATQKKDAPSNYYVYPQFYLASVAFHAQNNWAIWVNDQKITHMDEDKVDLSVTAIDKRKVSLLWRPASMEKVSASLAKHPNDSILVDSVHGTVQFTLYPNQTFSSYDMKVVEGKIAPVVLNITPLPVEKPRLAGTGTAPPGPEGAEEAQIEAEMMMQRAKAQAAAAASNRMMDDPQLRQYFEQRSNNTGSSMLDKAKNMLNLPTPHLPNIPLSGSN
jgi:hypothetical protein